MDNDNKIKTNYINKTNRLILFLSALLIFIFFFIWCVVECHYYDEPVTEKIFFFLKDDDCITLEKFDKIKDGMTYAQVARLIGKDGELLSHTDIGIGKKYISDLYVWYGSDGISNANICFQAGRVTMKSQFGLK